MMDKLTEIAKDLSELSLSLNTKSPTAIIGFVCDPKNQAGFCAPLSRNEAESLMLEIISKNPKFDILEKATLKTLAKKLRPATKNA